MDDVEREVLRILENPRLLSGEKARLVAITHRHAASPDGDGHGGYQARISSARRKAGGRRIKGADSTTGMDSKRSSAADGRLKIAIAPAGRV